MSSHWAGQPLLDALLWNSEEAHICFQMDGMITFWNRAAELLYGFSASEVLGKHISSVQPLCQRPAIEELLRSPLRIESAEPEASERIHKQGMHIPIGCGAR
jgi:PAS domain S-box-containing protein